VLDRMFAVMALCPQHVFQVLTKRPERMRRYFSSNSAICLRSIQDGLSYDGAASTPLE
jgi:protein gp37